MDEIFIGLAANDERQTMLLGGSRGLPGGPLR